MTNTETMNDVSAAELADVSGGDWLFEALKCAGGIAGGSAAGFEVGSVFPGYGNVAGAIIGGAIGAAAFCF